MTREEALKIWLPVIEMGVANMRECKEALDIAIKALEQEPFINKPCVSSGVCEHDKNKVLDKIRAEIDSHCSDNRDRNDGLYIAMKIIDKYIAEGSEE